MDEIGAGPLSRPKLANSVSEKRLRLLDAHLANGMNVSISVNHSASIPTQYDFSWSRQRTRFAESNHECFSASFRKVTTTLREHHNFLHQLAYGRVANMVGNLEWCWNMAVRITSQGADVTTGVEKRNVANLERCATQRRILACTQQAGLARRSKRNQVIPFNLRQGVLKTLLFVWLEAGSLVDNHTLRKLASLLLVPLQDHRDQFIGHLRCQVR